MYVKYYELIIKFSVLRSRRSVCLSVPQKIIRLDSMNSSENSLMILSINPKVETKEELVSTVERQRVSPLAVERVDWRRLDSRDLIQ